MGEQFSVQQMLPLNKLNFSHTVAESCHNEPRIFVI